MRKLGISTAKSRHITRGWENQSVTWEELVERLSSPAVTGETAEEYKALSSEKRNAIKDVGGFVGGWSKDGRRRLESIYSRDVLTFDYDEFNKEGLERVESAMSGKAWCLYSTHSHTDEAWRVRVVIPMSREAMPDEYPAVARKIAEKLGMKGLDKGSFDLNRLMYWPSVSKGAPFLFRAGEGGFVDPDEIKAEYDDWRDAGQWPLTSEESGADLFNPSALPGSAMRAFSKRGNGGRMQDPTEKKGVVGAWCRTYDVPAAISKFLGGHYQPAPNGHYTHVGSSTVGNAKITEGGKLIYSFHGTDPLQGMMLNSWDLVRLCLFRDKDEEAPAGTRTERLPSTKAMEAFAMEDVSVKRRILKERVNDFADIDTGEEPGEDVDAMTDALLEGLTLRKGEIEVTAANVSHILENDGNLKGKFRHNLFLDITEITGPLPWPTDSETWKNVYGDCLLTYFDKTYGMRKNTQVIERTFRDHRNRNSYHPVKEYLEGLEWDGVKRLDGLFTDVLGAEDTELNRKLAELVFTAAVRRIYQPGVKFDYCVILHGPEGVYKSSLFALMGGRWFTDDVSSIEGKESVEKLSGAWIVEISELTGLKKSEQANQKSFISRTVDKIRPAYGREVELRPRQCVIVGTTNEELFLKGINDKNRRFPVVEIDPKLRKIQVSPIDYVTRWRDQLWAEAKAIEAKGLPIYLSRDYDTAIRRIQDRHNMDIGDPMLQDLEDYLEWWLPERWESMTEDERRASTFDPHESGGVLTPKIRRRFFTIPEFMDEVMNIPRGHSQYNQISRRVGEYMKRFPEWKFIGSRKDKVLGSRRFWQREGTEYVPNKKSDVPNLFEGVPNGGWLDEDEYLVQPDPSGLGGKLNTPLLDL